MFPVVNKTKDKLRKIRKCLKSNSYDDSWADFLTPVTFAKDISSEKMRLNLCIPNLEQSKMYGGQRTALRFFLSLLKQLNCDGRILIESSYNTEIERKLNNQYPGWEIGPSMNGAASRQIVSITPRDRQSLSLPIRERDIFLYTYWSGGYVLSSYREAQNTFFGHHQPHLHLIQDFEPAFTSWSSRYMLADSVFRQRDGIAIFNSEELANWFDRLGYSYLSHFVFTPKLDPDLAVRLKNVSAFAKKPLLVFYGRPYVPRNCFGLVVKSLQLLLQQHPEVGDNWRILSIGSPIPSVNLADGKKLETTGKMSMSDYAALMEQTAVGVSLMCSPHPSYPPLEMAAFGIRTITNSFVTKDLSQYVSNIVSLPEVTFQSLADAIWEQICASEKSMNVSIPTFSGVYSGYLQSDADFFDGCVEGVAQQIRDFLSAGTMKS